MATERIISGMRFLKFALVFQLLCGSVHAQSLPELGEQSSGSLPPGLERRIGEQAMREIRYRDPQFIDDPELTDYINSLGKRLVSAGANVRQDFEFFMVRDGTINAFAMPGGFVGVHTGLLMAAQTESEVAGVLAHEIAHVTQRHIARMLGKQEQLSIVSLAAMVVALVAARSSNSDVGQGLVAAAGAGSLQAQLNYTRDFEREADRVGFQILQDSGLDVNGMASFFERLQKAGRVYDNNAPAYLRTHPLTTERIADIQNRSQGALYRQTPDSVEFHLVRAKLRADQGSPGEAVGDFSELVRERRYASEAGARYGLAAALMRSREYVKARAEIERVRELIGPHSMVQTLLARTYSASNDERKANEVLRAAVARQPNSRSLNYAYIESLQSLGQHQQALKVLGDLARNTPGDARPYGLQARSYSATGQRTLQHRALGELYYLQGTLSAAVEQLQLAQKSGDADFYVLSSIDARLREFRRLQAEEAKESKPR
jgi:predicted Zn-dependent protease